MTTFSVNVGNDVTGADHRQVHYIMFCFSSLLQPLSSLMANVAPHPTGTANNIKVGRKSLEP
jgi:hypothetical protein